MNRRILPIAFAVVCATASSGLCQVRGSRSLSTPGKLRTSVTESQSTFRMYSYGVGNLGSSPGGYGAQSAGVTQEIRRTGGGGASTSPYGSFSTRPTTTSLQASSTRVIGGASGTAAGSYGTPTSPRAGTGATAIATPLSGLDRIKVDATSPVAQLAVRDELTRLAVGSGGAFVRALSAAPRDADTKVSEDLTSLAPSIPGPYRDAILAGEQDFRDAKYRQALKQFRFAGSLSQWSSESLLSLARAEFAIGGTNLRLSADHLIEALKQMPELPLLPIDPRTFYGANRDFDQHLQKLRVEATGDDATQGMRLLYAYMLWRTGDAQGALALLEPLRTEDSPAGEAADILVVGIHKAVGASESENSQEADSSTSEEE